MFYKHLLVENRSDVGIFHNCGRVPVERILLSTNVSGSANASATSFRTRGW